MKEQIAKLIFNKKARSMGQCEKLAEEILKLIEAEEVPNEDVVAPKFDKVLEGSGEVDYSEDDGEPFTEEESETDIEEHPDEDFLD